MDLTIERNGGVLTIAVTGPLNAAVSATLVKTLEDTIAESDRAVILDFAGVSFIGNAAIRVVLSTAKYLQKRDSTLILCRLSDPVRKVLRITGFERFLTIHETRTGARAWMESSQPQFEDQAPWPGKTGAVSMGDGASTIASTEGEGSPMRTILKSSSASSLSRNRMVSGTPTG